MNKKILPLSFLILLIIPTVILAKNFNAGPVPNAINIPNINSIIDIILNFMWIIFVGFAIAFFVIASFLFLTAQGDPIKTSKANLVLLGGIIAVILGMLAFSLPFIIKSTIENNISKKATIPPFATGSLTITENVIGGTGNDTFSFIVSSSNFGPLPLNITATGIINESGFSTFNNLTPGSYSIVETVPSGWTKTTDTCNSVTVTASQTATCVVTDSKDTTITINTVVVNAPTNSGNFNLQINGITIGTGANVTNGGTTGAVPESPGTYIISETAGTNTILSDYNIVVSGQGCISNGATATVNLATGDNSVCTITNTYNPPPPPIGSLTITKNTTAGSGDGPFDFSIVQIPLVPITKTITTTGNTAITSGTGSVTISNLTPGIYLVSETIPSGWTKNPSSCNFVTVVAGSIPAICVVTNTKNLITSYSAYLLKAWENTGRPWLASYSGLKWDIATKQWESSTVSQPFIEQTAQEAYTAEFASQAGVNIAIGGNNLGLADELAKYYQVYLQTRFTTFGQMRQLIAASQNTGTPLDGSFIAEDIPDATRVLPWYQKTSTSTHLRECSLCQSQYLQPTARLIRFIASIPSSQRTPAMNTFVPSYTDLIVHDHLHRLVDIHDEGGTHRLQFWQDLNSGKITTPGVSVSDSDLWKIATAAEILGAHSQDPVLVPLSDADVADLKNIVSVGTQAFQHARTLATVHDSNGNIVNSVFYFNYYTESPDYSGYTGETYPTTADLKTVPHSWDISHFHRVPTFLRSLIDNSSATGVAYPASDLALLGNHYAYGTFQGDYTKPLFNNYFDGTNGWFRVGYGGPNFGYPPAQYCEITSKNRPCLTIAGIFGWGQLAAFDAHITNVQQSLIDLAKSTDPTIACFGPTCFRDRYYKYGLSFSFNDSQGKEQYPFALMEVLADMGLGK